MAKAELPSEDVLRQLLAYDPATGSLTWQARTPADFTSGSYSAERKCEAWNAKNAGRPALDAVKQGYRHGSINGRVYLAHRVIWKMVTGCDPDQIDHINGHRSDNRLCNLRDVSNAQNMRNKGRYRRNRSGVTGVRWYKQTSRWRSEIECDGRRIDLGYHTCFARAVAARRDAEIEYGFSERHGLPEQDFNQGPLRRQPDVAERTAQAVRFTLAERQS